VSPLHQPAKYKNNYEDQQSVVQRHQMESKSNLATDRTQNLENNAL